VYDKTYLPLNAIDRNNIALMIIVGKPAVLAAWKWYEHHLNIVTTLLRSTILSMLNLQIQLCHYQLLANRKL